MRARVFGKPKLVSTESGKPSWEIEVQCRCPTCGKLFVTKNTGNTAESCLFTAGGKMDEFGLWITECGFDCFDEETKQKVRDSVKAFCKECGIDKKEIETDGQKIFPGENNVAL